MYYTVKEIAEMLHIGEETVRRWIRDDKLKAERGVGRQGSKVEESVLKDFVEKNKNLLTPKASVTLGIGVNMFSNAGEVIGEIAQNTISAVSSFKIMNILKSKNKGKRQMIKELEEQKLELQKSSMQIKLEIARQQNELRSLEEQIKIIDEMIDE